MEWINDIEWINNKEDLMIWLILGIPLLILLFGFLLWKSARKNYDYNIYGVGVLVRLSIAGFFCYISVPIGLILLGVAFIWNFIVTWRNTSFFIAFFSILFQPIALLFSVFLIIKILNRIKKYI